MNISEISNELANVQTLSVEFSVEDYTPEYKKELKNAAKKIALPGFRQGKVPTSLIEQKYGQGLLNEILQRESEKVVGEYCKEHNIQIYGGILPSQLQESYNFKVGQELKLYFDLLVIPPVDFPTEPEIEVKRPIFSPEFWKEFDRKLLRNPTLENCEQVGDKTLFSVTIERPMKREEENGEITWRHLESAVVDYEALPSSIREKLLGKRENESQVLANEEFAPFGLLCNLDRLEKDTEEEKNLREKEGFRLTVNKIVRYKTLNSDEELLVLRQHYIQSESDTIPEDITREALIEKIHTQHQKVLEFICLIAGVHKYINDKIAAHWTFEIPLRIVDLFLYFSHRGEAKPEYSQFESLMYRYTVRQESFIKQLQAKLKEQEQFEKDDFLTSLRLYLALFNSHSSSAEGMFIQSIWPAQTFWAYGFSQMQQNEQFKNRIMNDAIYESICYAIGQTAQIKYVDTQAQELSLRNLVEVVHPSYEFPKLESEEKEFAALFAGVQGGSKASESPETPVDSTPSVDDK